MLKRAIFFADNMAKAERPIWRVARATVKQENNVHNSVGLAAALQHKAANHCRAMIYFDDLNFCNNNNNNNIN